MIQNSSDPPQDNEDGHEHYQRSNYDELSNRLEQLEITPAAAKHYTHESSPSTRRGIESLSPEILYQVAELLSAAERTSLAMCSKYLYQRVPIFGTDKWDSLDDKFELLHLLIRCLPAWLCYRCRCVHYGRQMFPGLWHLNPMHGASWQTIFLGNTRTANPLGLPYCGFDVSTRAKLQGGHKIQKYTSALAYENGSQSNLALNSTFSTAELPGGLVLGYKQFTFWARYDKWHGSNILFSEAGVDMGVNLDLCKHLSLRRTQPMQNIIADILQCGWIMASHKYHGEECTNATCQGGYQVPKGHETCTPGLDNMRHSGTCEYCPTEFVVEMWPHWHKEEKVLDIQVWHDLSVPEFEQQIPQATS